MTPLPIGALAAIGVALFTNSLIITVLFPFAPLIVEYFQVTSDEADVGYDKKIASASGKLLTLKFLCVEFLDTMLEC